MDSGWILQPLVAGVIAAVTAAIASVWQVSRAGLEEGVRESARRAVSEEMDKKFQDSVLARELARVRGTERQELRFSSYGQLWARMKPLAIYETTPVDAETVGRMSRDLSAWYFSDTGGLLLTSHNRELYFALQTLLGEVSRLPDWQAHRGSEDPKDVFGDLITAPPKMDRTRQLTQILANAHASDWPPDGLQELAVEWHKSGAREFVGRWGELGEEERFSVLQQAASLLRTGLTLDVESRLR